MTTTTATDVAVPGASRSGAVDHRLDRQMREKLTTARVCLLLKAAFFGNIATRLRLTNADEWCETAATDGRNFYYNSEFINRLRPKEVEFLIAHEILHCVYDHFGRRNDRDPRIWNIANDYCVNADLKHHKIGEFITTVPCLYDLKYQGKSSEEIYDILMEQAEKINVDWLVTQLLDEHLDDDSKNPNVPKLSDVEKQQIRDEIRSAVLAAAATADGADNIPRGVKRLIKDFTEPKLNWRDLLRAQLESTIKADYTYMKVNRKSWHMQAVMPGAAVVPMIDIVVAIDTSGSISEVMLKDFLGEIQGIMDVFPSFKITVFSFDTQVYNACSFDSDNLDSMIDYEPQGGGGTDFVAIFDYLKAEGIEPERLVVFTDGCPFGSWGDEHYADTLWILHSTDSIEAPWGQFAYYR